MANKLVAPFVKWVGGKRQLLDEIVPLLPGKVSSYCEPCVGGGAVLFSIQPKNAIVNDLNKDLIGVYKTVKDNVEDLIKDLAKHFYLNPDYIARIFKKYTNTTINSYITMQRIAAARRMLISGSSISEAQQNTGYSSYSHFFRIFKKETGMTPREFVDMYSKTE